MRQTSLNGMRWCKMSLLASFCQRQKQTQMAPGENELLGATQVASSCNCFPKRPIIIMLSVHSLHPLQVNKNRAIE